MRTRFATIRRRQCAASSIPTSGRVSATSSSASRRAMRRIDGRHATTLAARGARERSAISPKSAPFTRRASVITAGGSAASPFDWRLAFVARLGRVAAHLELAARDDVRLRPFLSLAMTACPCAHGDHLERRDERAEPLLRELAEERERRDERGLGVLERVVRLLRLVDDLRRLREERGPGEKRAQRDELGEARAAAAEGGPSRRRGETSSNRRPRRSRRGAPRCSARASAGRLPTRPRAAGSRRRSRASPPARTPRRRPPAVPASARRRDVRMSALGTDPSCSTTAALQRSAASRSPASMSVSARSRGESML